MWPDAGPPARLFQQLRFQNHVQPRQEAWACVQLGRRVFRVCPELHTSGNLWLEIVRSALPELRRGAALERQVTHERSVPVVVAPRPISGNGCAGRHDARSSIRPDAFPRQTEGTKGLARPSTASLYRTGKPYVRLGGMKRNLAEQEPLGFERRVFAPASSPGCSRYCEAQPAPGSYDGPQLTFAGGEQS